MFEHVNSILFQQNHPDAESSFHPVLLWILLSSMGLMLLDTDCLYIVLSLSSCCFPLVIKPFPAQQFYKLECTFKRLSSVFFHAIETRFCSVFLYIPPIPRRRASDRCRPRATRRDRPAAALLPAGKRTLPTPCATRNCRRSKRRESPLAPASGKSPTRTRQQPRRRNPVQHRQRRCGNRSPIACRRAKRATHS